MNSPTSMGMIIIIKLRMMSKTFLACDFKLQPFYLHNAICCNINMKSLQLSTQWKCSFIFARSDFRLQVYVAEVIRTLQNLCEKSRSPSESKVFIPLKPYGTRIEKYQRLSTYPSSTVSTFDEHLMLLDMDLTLTTTFKESRMTVLQFLQAAQKKQCLHACEKLSSVFEM